MAIPNLAADEAPAGGEDDYVVLETRRHAARLRRRGLRAARPRRARPDARRDRHRARRQGVGLALLLPHRRRRRSSSSRWSTWRWTRPATPGFTPMIPPSLVKPRAMEGTGFLGQAADDVYRLEGEDLYLVGTSEVPLAAYHSDEILDGADAAAALRRVQPVLPQGGRLARQGHPGIIRVHWFDKVEMFVYTTLEESDAEHQRLLDWEKEFLDKLELAYRVIDVAAGDLGLSAPAQVRLRGVDPDAGPLPRAHLDLELHRVPGPAARHPRRGSTSGDRRRSPRSTARCARSTAHDRRDPRDPPAGGRLGAACPQALRPYLGGRRSSRRV